MEDDNAKHLLVFSPSKTTRGKIGVIDVITGIALKGNWKQGWAIELHTLKSFLRKDGTFETERTEIGEALYRLKYRNDLSQIPFIAKSAINFMMTKEELRKANVILPIPPSNIYRTVQPVFEIANIIGKELGIRVDLDYLFRTRKSEQIKEVDDPKNRGKLLRNSFKLNGVRYADQTVLLFDDLYRSGATLYEVTRVLYEIGQVRCVFVFTLTKTRTKR